MLADYTLHHIEQLIAMLSQTTHEPTCRVNKIERVYCKVYAQFVQTIYLTVK